MKFFYCTEKENKPDNFSQLIMDVLQTDYSHALILVEDIPLDVCVYAGFPINKSIIFHATIPKYSWTTLHAELAGGANEINNKIPIKVRDEMFALGWLIGNMGKDYSLSQSLGVLYPRLRDIYGNGEGKGFCSEFTARFGAINGVRPDVFESVDLEFADPKMALELFTKHNDFAPV